MIKTKVIYIGPIRNLSGKREEEIELPKEATIQDLLNILMQKYGQPFQEAIFNKEGELHPMLRILLRNGQDHTSGLDTKLKHMEKVTLLQLLQPLAGG